MTRRSTKQPQKILPLTVVVFGLIVLAGGVYFLLGPPPEPAPTEEPLQTLSIESIVRVNLPDARQALEAGSAVFVDVRDKSSFDSAHIPGAQSIPLNELPDRKGELDPNTWIITYCT